MRDKNFFWGTATASYQVEGGIDNCDWALAAKAGKEPVCGKADDHYNRYQADFDLAKQIGTNAHRFSIEWSRIEPQEGVFDEKEIEHYRQVIQALHTRGMEPFVTLWHFTLPAWFSKSGGFARRDSAYIFARYCEYVISKLGGEAHFWMTMNEPLVWLGGGHWKGEWPPFYRRSFVKTVKGLFALIRAHKMAYTQMKRVAPHIEVGIAKHNVCFESNRNPFNKIQAVIARWGFNHFFLKCIKGHQDFIGLNHYISKRFGLSSSFPKTEMGWDVYPDAFYKVLMELKRYNLPVYVTENGLADSKDILRAGYLRGYISSLKRAKKEGLDVRGYFYWSLLDNYEWAFGFTRRFGLIEVDYETLERTVRPSARTYTEIINSYSGDFQS